MKGWIMVEPDGLKDDDQLKASSRPDFFREDPFGQ
jgi:hypothetical protein